MKRFLQSSIFAATMAGLLIALVTFAPIPMNLRPGAPVQAQVSLPLGPYGNFGFLATAQNATATVPAFQWVGIITSTTAAAVTLTTDTATNFCALFPFIQTLTPGNANFVFDSYIKNTTGTSAITLTGGAGVTVIGSGGVTATASVRHLKFQLVNCTAGSAAVNVYSLETSTF